MMNTTFKRYIFIALVAFVSCTKLDEKPTDFIDPNRAFRNIGDINGGLIGAYALVDAPIGVTSTVSDEATFPTENTVGNSDAFRWLYNPSSGSVTSMYGDYYRGIDRVNRTLAGLAALSLTGNDVALADRYKGELLALRAFFHFELLRAYASAYQPGALGVPYMKFSAVNYYPARDNFETVVSNAKADLAEAKGLIPTSYADKSRVTRLAVSAMQARIALYEKNWADAITYSTEVITAAPLATKAQFPGIWTDANEAEVIWKAKRVGADSRVGDFYFRQTGGIVLYAPSFKLIGTFDQVNDIRFPAYIRYDATRTSPRSQYLVNKYIGAQPTTAPGLADIKLFRTGEMYLIRAEARAETNALADGAADLNTLRTARINNYVAATFADKAALIDAIMLERFKELAFEGHRFYDLRRRGLPVQRPAQDAVNASGAVLLNPSQAQYAFPIPATEVLINKATVQNPNY